MKNLYARINKQQLFKRLLINLLRMKSLLLISPAKDTCTQISTQKKVLHSSFAQKVSTSKTLDECNDKVIKMSIIFTTIWFLNNWLFSFNQNKFVWVFFFWLSRSILD